MTTLLNYINGLLQDTSLSNFWASLCASLICAMSIICIAYIICASVSLIIKRFIVKKINNPNQKQTIEDFLKALRRFGFIWIISAWMPDILFSFLELQQLFARLLSIITVAFAAAAISAAITFFHSIIHVESDKKALSSKTFIQVAKIIIWATASIIIVATLMNKSPAFVLSGLGALTAVLMLIFKDSLLGLVAGIQVTQNDMVRIGDWITMTKHNADGTVIDISLTTVKVRNFDNTVTMIPASILISDAFVNWRYMSVSKGRRIKRPIWINANSVRELDEQTRLNLVEQGLLDKDDRPISNLAAFECWLRKMLSTHEEITQELTCMVRQTEASSTGIPVEVYCFTKNRNWIDYEFIQTSLFDKIFVTVPKFTLQIYQRSGDNSKQVSPQATIDGSGDNV